MLICKDFGTFCYTITKVKSKHAEKLDVDVRFLLANERTLLAWVRTALAIMAGGLAFSQFSSGENDFFGVLSVAFGAIMTLFGYARYRIADAAIRNGHLPTQGTGPFIQVAGVVVFAIVIIAVEVVS